MAKEKHPGPESRYDAGTRNVEALSRLCGHPPESHDAIVFSPRSLTIRCLLNGEDDERITVLDAAPDFWPDRLS